MADGWKITEPYVNSRGETVHSIDPGYHISGKPREDRPRKREKKHPDRWLKKRVKGRLTAKRVAKLFGGVS